MTFQGGVTLTIGVWGGGLGGGCWKDILTKATIMKDFGSCWTGHPNKHANMGHWVMMLIDTICWIFILHSRFETFDEPGFSFLASVLIQDLSKCRFWILDICFDYRSRY